MTELAAVSWEISILGQGCILKAFWILKWKQCFPSTELFKDQLCNVLVETLLLLCARSHRLKLQANFKKNAMTRELS